MNKPKNYIGISLDTSRSMYNITRPAARDYNETIATIKKAARDNDIDTIVSVVKCGVGMQAVVERMVTNSNVQILEPISESSYVASGYATPLFDSVGMLIEMFEAMPDANDENVSFLINVVTDGEDNRSPKWKHKIADKIRQLQATDRWTFVFRVPSGGASTLTRMGIPGGNISTWEQSERGMQTSSVATQSSFTNYYTARASGAKSTTAFFADIDHVSPAEIKNKLVDVSGQCRRLLVTSEDHSDAIRHFVELRVGEYTLGKAFYQLSKREIVQPSKDVCIYDRAMDRIYRGQAARDLIGLPSDRDVTIAPRSVGKKYDVFIQSTSVNRKVVEGTTILYFDR